MKVDYRNLDWHLIGSALALSVIGIAMIYSAQYDASTGASLNYYLRQSLWLLVALLAFGVVIRIPLRTIDVASYVLYAGAFLLLLLVLVIGSSRMGASRWFDLGPLSFSPSDIAKLALLISLSRFFAYTRLPPQSKRRLSFSAVMAIVPAVLIMKQPDLGTSLVLIALLFSLWFWSGLSPLYILLIVSPLISLVAAFHWIPWVIYLILLIVYIMFLKPGFVFGVFTIAVNLAFGVFTPFIWNHLADYQKLRVITFLDPGRDPQRAGYQIIQSKIAIGSGGILGKGYLGGSQSQLKFLPERHTDFVFSVVGEELGLWGTLLVVGIFAYLFYRGMKIAARCRSKFASNLAWGALTILFFQFFVNIGMTLGLMPVTGLPLPFVSYGGTSLLLSWVLIGLIAMAEYQTDY
ncbi:Rod shape-determining protein RodA [Candidatus Zixiibacteriota bacterium]|nr:Rod shape-determining protein RodA [candidate division Zixibacteria bacterium]